MYVTFQYVHRQTHLELGLQGCLLLQQPPCLVICLRLELPVLSQLCRIQLHISITSSTLKAILQDSTGNSKGNSTADTCHGLFIGIHALLFSLICIQLHISITSSTLKAILRHKGTAKVTARAQAAHQTQSKDKLSACMPCLSPNQTCIQHTHTHSKEHVKGTARAQHSRHMPQLSHRHACTAHSKSASSTADHQTA
jgi:hypothetical protein